MLKRRAQGIEGVRHWSTEALSAAGYSVRLTRDGKGMSAEVEPRQSCSSLLHKVRLKPRPGKPPHILEISRRESLHLGERCLKVMREAVDHLRAPPLRGLAFQDVAADLPVQQHELLVHRKGGALLGRVNALFEIAEPVCVTRRNRQ
jgi:hypothetical protein